MPWNVVSNNTVDAVNNAYWLPAADVYGKVTAFTAVAKDDMHRESRTAVQAQVQVTPVNDLPTGTLSSILGTTAVTATTTVKQGDTLTIASTLGTTDKVTVSDWYTGSQYHVEQIKSSDSKVLLDTQMDKLVQAMANMAPSVQSQASLTSTQIAQLAPALAGTTWLLPQS